MINILRRNDDSHYIIYDQPYNKHWTDEELLIHVIELNCSFNNLISIPPLPNCKYLNCVGNQITELPPLPKCKTLICSDNQLIKLVDLTNCRELQCDNNQLTSLPVLTNCDFLKCSNNQLTRLPKLPKCVYIDCDRNQLTYLPELPQCLFLNCDTNPLSLFDLDDYQKLWKFKHFYLKLKYIRLWYWGLLKLKAEKKYQLHLELKYSPNLPFYKKNRHYKHFKKLQQSLSQKKDIL